MNYKERTVPIVILICEALLRRLLEIHPARALIQEELGRRIAGYRGELILDRYTNQLPL